MRELWQILICSIPHRDNLLCELLAELDAQIVYDDVKVIIARDNLEQSYGMKMDFLFTTATAKYISVVDDDDTVSPDYVHKIRSALLQDPDYVGYQVLWTVDDVRHIPIDHSLRHGRWDDGPASDGSGDPILRDISEKNPIRREIATKVPWQGAWGAERVWAEEIRRWALNMTELGKPTLTPDREIYIPEELYHYRYRNSSHFQTSRQPLPFPLQPLPAYPWLTVYEVAGESVHHLP